MAAILGQKCAGIATSLDRGAATWPFPILCDEDRSVIKAYGVWHPIGIDAINMARPASFLIGASTRTIRYVFVGSSQVERADLPAILKVAETL